MKAGDRLSNGAILLDETVYKTDLTGFGAKKMSRSIVLAMNPGNVEPFVTWDRLFEQIEYAKQAPSVQDSFAMGHYHRTATAAWHEYNDRCERHTGREKATKAITERATDDAKSASSWIVYDGNRPTEDIQRILTGIEDGDPAVLDELPHPRISGEWADDPTFEQIFREELDLSIKERQNVQTHPLYDEMIMLYEDVFSEKVVQFIEATARELLGK